MDHLEVIAGLVSALVPGADRDGFPKRGFILCLLLGAVLPPALHAGIRDLPSLSGVVTAQENGRPLAGIVLALFDAAQHFVGPRNRAGRFPTLATLDVRLTRSFRFWKWTAEVGFRVYHLLNSFAPRAVQANVDAPDFGTFYNTIPRNWGFTLQFRK